MILIKSNWFDLKNTFDSGQCFRYKKINENEYIVITHGKVLKLEQVEDGVKFYCTKKEYENIWEDYFNMNLDYEDINKKIVTDKIVKEAIEFSKGTRILKQEKFECLISFIISQNNRIPQIKKVIENISKKYGNEIEEGIYSFPTVKQLKKATKEDLRKCKTGFRDKYIIDAVEKISTGEVDLEKIDKLPTKDAKKELMKIKGIGTKVADCVLLFAYNRYEVFPEDVWVKRIMKEYYNVKRKDIQRYKEKIWGAYAGIAQQYLFYYIRSIS